ncbi:MAG: nucleotide exchange factor GrpE, partial [Actinomycetota bacterium]
GGEGWAKTVVDGLAEKEAAGGESASPAPPAEPQHPGAEAPANGDAETAEAAEAHVADDDIIDAELVDDPDTDAPSDPAAGPEAASAQNAEVADAEAPANGAGISVEDLVADLERVSVERDQYLDASRRLQAEFENYKKQVAKRESEARERANDSLIGELLPVLDAFDGALANGAEDVAPMRGSFLDALTKQGLERIDPADGAFDPNLHEAVMHEPGDEADGPVVAEVMRAGYVWKGRVLRPAMVKTRG